MGGGRLFSFFFPLHLSTVWPLFVYAPIHHSTTSTHTHSQSADLESSEQYVFAFF